MTAMLLPYHNCLICLNKQNNQESNTDHLQSYLAQCFEQNKIMGNNSMEIYVVGSQHSIYIQPWKEITQQVLQNPPINLSIITLSSISQFTSSPETILLASALASIQIGPAPSPKHPAQLTNLSSLRQYFLTYKSEPEFKQFLKEVLIEEISSQERRIRYRSEKEVNFVVEGMKRQLRGEVTMKGIAIEKVKQIERKTKTLKIWIWLVPEQELHTNIFKLILQAQKIFYIDPSISTPSTSKILSIHAHKYIFSMSDSLFAHSLATTLPSTLFTSRNILNTSAIVKIVCRYGMKLAEEQRELEQAFREYVSELTEKNGKMIEKYLKGLRWQIEYQRDKLLYRKTEECNTKIQLYFRGFILQQTYFNKHQQYRQSQITNIQRRVRTFLALSSRRTLLLSHYLSSESSKFHSLIKQYTQLITTHNRSQLALLKKHNPHKYGFSCCIHLVSMVSKSNCLRFGVEEVKGLLERAGKEVIVRIRVQGKNGQIVRIVTVNGKQYSFGNSDEPGGYQTYRSISASRNTGNLKEQPSSVFMKQNMPPNHTYFKHSISPSSSPSATSATNCLGQTFTLTPDHKLYLTSPSPSTNTTAIHIPTDFTLAFDSQHLVKTGGSNLEIVYLVGYWTNSIDVVARNRVKKYLLEVQEEINKEGQIQDNNRWTQQKSESMLVDSKDNILNQTQYGQSGSIRRQKWRDNLNDLSAIDEQPLFQ